MKLQVTPIDGEADRFFVQSGSRPDVQHIVDMAWQVESQDKPRPCCSCENVMAKGKKTCRHIRAVQLHLSQPDYTAADFETIPMTTLRPISTRQSERLKEYRRVKRIWKRTLIVLGLWFCKRCGDVPEDSPHHLRGRIGALLCFHPLFVPVCRRCHAWIGDHPAEARALKLLCEIGEWGKQP